MGERDNATVGRNQLCSLCYLGCFSCRSLNAFTTSRRVRALTNGIGTPVPRQLTSNAVEYYSVIAFPSFPLWRPDAKKKKIEEFLSFQLQLHCLCFFGRKIVSRHTPTSQTHISAHRFVVEGAHVEIFPHQREEVANCGTLPEAVGGSRIDRKSPHEPKCQVPLGVRSE